MGAPELCQKYRLTHVAFGYMVLSLEIYFILPKDNNHVVFCRLTVNIGISIFHILF